MVLCDGCLKCIKKYSIFPSLLSYQWRGLRVLRTPAKVLCFWSAAGGCSWLFRESFTSVVQDLPAYLTQEKNARQSPTKNSFLLIF